MTFDQNSNESFYDQPEATDSNHNSEADLSEQNESTNFPEKIIDTLSGFTSSYRDFQSKIGENKKLIEKLQSEIQTSKEQKKSLEAELSKMPAPDSLKEQHEDSENFSHSYDTPSSESSEDHWHSDDQPEEQHDDRSTDEVTKAATNDQVLADASESKNKVKACSTIERYIAAIKSSIDDKSEHSEAYLQPLNVSCNLLGSQVKHIKLLEHLVAVLDEQRSLKAKEKEMHDIIELLAEQFSN